MLVWTRWLKGWNPAVPLFGAVLGWLVIQNTFLFVTGVPRQDSPALVVVRALGRAILAVVQQYPLTVALFVAVGALAILLGVASWRDTSMSDREDRS